MLMTKMVMEPQGLGKCIFLLPIFLQVIQHSFSSSLLRRNETDRLSLLAFKSQITNDPLNILSSWNQSLHFCQWSGVTCGPRHLRVIELDLQSCRLSGSLSPHIGNLSFLRILNLVNNSLTHNIPQEIGNLFRLQMLSLRNNSITGEIPVNISHCSNLITLIVRGNNLTGKLPAELGYLSKLQTFIFEVNNLVGEIPSSFGNLSSLERMYGTTNNLNGNIPTSIGQLTILKVFSLGENNLSGIIPSSMYNTSSLALLSVLLNQLEGSLPQDLGETLPNLQILRLFRNKFNGLIPVTISNASNLVALDLSLNNFSGKVPSFAHLHNLSYLGIYGNNLGNDEDDDLSFLYSLANNTKLEVLGITDNNLGGVMPKIISNFSTMLTQMALGSNRIRGSIPTEIGNFVSLEALGFETNQLTGTIPSSLGNISSLVVLYLKANKLEGSVPLNLGNCTKLVRLSLSKNNLSGSIPKEIVGIRSLSITLDLSENQLTGSLPLEVGNLVSLGNLDVSKNKLSGEIPESLGSCTSMESLYLDNNFLQGTIPESLSSLRAIKDLNLSYNNLSGEIPKFLGEWKLLENLDLSYNDFEGELPAEGVFRNASAFSVSGNENLCGGIPQLSLPRCISNESTKTKSSSKLRLIIAAAVCGVLGVVFMITLVLSYSLKRRRKKSVFGSSLETFFQKVPYQDLFRATDGFSSTNLIGAGSFGSVYKGILAPGEMAIAVKVLNLLHKGASKSFMAQCEALKNIRHRNVVKILTACSSIDSQGNDFKALVYEFMANGSLEEWLHPRHNLAHHQPRNLNLIQRINIALDVASALDYLHHQCQVPIVHYDLKPSNVLLDNDMTAHVGDFGLARFLLEAPHHSSSNPSSSIGIKGTIGYAAPEYGMGGEVSKYGDVYSYGILLLEMFTGKKPTDEMFKDGLNLHNLAKMALPNRAIVAVDPFLLREDEGTSANASQNITSDKTLECLVSVLKVGVACSEELPRNRMDIGQVVAELLRIKKILNTERHR